MRRTRKLIASLTASSVIASTLIATPVAAQRVEIGNAATVVGEVEISNAQITDPRPIVRRERVAWGDLIETKRRSQLQILLLDRSTFGVGARSSLRIDSFVYDPDEGRSLFATFIRGALRYFSGSQDGENSADIQTPSGRIGIRGTALDLMVGNRAKNIGRDEAAVGNVRSNDDEATLVILRGPGAATAGGLTPGIVEVEAAGVTVILDRPGLAAFIPRNGAPPIGPFPISNEGLTRVQERLAPEVARAADSGGGLLETLIPVAVGAVALGLILSSGDGDDGVSGQPTADTGPNREPPPVDPKQPDGPYDGNDGPYVGNDGPDRGSGDTNESGYAEEPFYPDEGGYAEDPNGETY